MIIEEASMAPTPSQTKKSFQNRFELAETPNSDNLTLEQAEQIADGRSYELINGEMIFKMPDSVHSETQTLLSFEISAYLKSNPVARVRAEFTMRPWPEKPNEGRIPDLSIILNENIKKGERFATRAPDIAVEIVSLDDKWSAIFEKAKLYLETGSRYVWIVDPYQKGVEIITKNSREWVNDALTCPDLLPGLSVNLQQIFEWPFSIK